MKRMKITHFRELGRRGEAREVLGSIDREWPTEALSEYGECRLSDDVIHRIERPVAEEIIPVFFGRDILNLRSKENRWSQ